MIDSLTLHNFKCFGHQSIGLRGLTLLSGLNGTGKSTAIQALLLLRQSFQQGLLTRGRLALNGEFVQIGLATDALHEQADDDIIGLSLQFRGGESARWTFTYDQSADVLAGTSADVGPGVFASSLFGEAFQYLCAERVGPRATFPVSDFEVREHHQLGRQGEFTAHFLDKYASKPVHEALRHPSALSSSLKDQAEAWLGEFSPGARIHITQHAGLDLVQLQFSFTSGSDVSNRYRSTNVGFGLTYTLPILVALLAAEPDSILLIENPEAHLHPRGQARMGHLLARVALTSAQVIVETHSDHVLNGIRVAVHDGEVKPDDIALHFFSTTLGHRRRVESPRLQPDGRLDFWPDDFFDQWDRSLESLLAPSPGGR